MKQTAFAVAILSVLSVGEALAQSCTPNPLSPPPQDSLTINARHQAADLFQYLAPQLGQTVSGGSATLGQNSTLGGLGHFSVGVHGTVVAGSVPNVNQFPTCYTGSRSTVLATSKSALPMAGADAAIGLFSGLPLALTNVGAVDALVTAQYIPDRTVSGVRVTAPDGSLQLGYGVRLGLLSESLLVPGISLSYIRRDLPRVSASATSSSGDSLLITGFKVKSSSWRLAASKSLIIISLGAGVGQDKLTSSVDSVSARVNPPVSAPARGSIVALEQSVTRTNYFVNASFNLLLAKLTAEVGQSTGGSVTTFNSFSGGQPTGARTYASLGLRIGL